MEHTERTHTNLSKEQKLEALNKHIVRRGAAIKWWNSLTFEHKFYKVIEWLKNKNRDTTERHPNSLTGSEIEEIHRHCALDLSKKTRL